MAAALDALETELEYRFRDREFLIRALTHKSRTHETGAPDVVADNEQLEFLGDSILGFIVSDWLVAQFPAYPEGRLSKIKAHLVSASHLHKAAESLHLGEYLILGRGEELSGGRSKKALLANAMEALIAAVYLDGGVEAARRTIVVRVLGNFDPAQNVEPFIDFKSALQELAQTLNLPPPRYATVEEQGPEHAKTFVVEVRVGKEWAGRASGLSKKSAGQIAAQEVLRKLLEWRENRSGRASVVNWNYPGGAIGID
jgi:ribonuclease-3